MSILNYSVFQHLHIHHSSFLVLLNDLLHLAGFFALALHIQKHTLDILRGDQQLWLQGHQNLLHPADLIARTVEPAEARLVPPLALQHFLPLPVQQILERADELQIGRRRDIIVASQLEPEVLRQILRRRVKVLAHLDAGVTLVLRHVDLAEELGRDREQRVLRPRLQPVDGAAVDEGRELADPRAETVADRRHRHHDVQVLAHGLHEEVEERHRAAVRLQGSFQVHFSYFILFRKIVHLEKYNFKACEKFFASFVQYFANLKLLLLIETKS